MALGLGVLHGGLFRIYCDRRCDVSVGHVTVGLVILLKEKTVPPRENWKKFAQKTKKKHEDKIYTKNLH